VLAKSSTFTASAGNRACSHAAATSAATASRRPESMGLQYPRPRCSLALQAAAGHRLGRPLRMRGRLRAAAHAVTRLGGHPHGSAQGHDGRADLRPDAPAQPGLAGRAEQRARCQAHHTAPARHAAARSPPQSRFQQVCSDDRLELREAQKQATKGCPARHWHCLQVPPCWHWGSAR